MGPREIIEKWVEAFNRANADELAAFYHDEALNHQMPNEPVIGKNAIREMFRQEFSMAEMTCIPVQILEDGDWAALEWKDPNGMRGCGFFQVVKDKIMVQRGYWDKASMLRLSTNK